jgi:hypothetical protein
LSGALMEQPNDSVGENDTYANMMYLDPRGAHFGIRIIAMQPQFSI